MDKSRRFNAAIYSGGPSIAILAKSEMLRLHDIYDLRIGINAGFALLPDRFCHWYAAGDKGAYRRRYTTNRPAVGWCCMCQDERSAILADDPDWDSLRSLVWDDLPDLRSVCTPSYSITAAIALAAHLGAESITLFGHDCIIGQPNANGVGSDYYPTERARKESQEFSDITRVLSGRCTITRSSHENHHQSHG